MIRFLTASTGSSAAPAPALQSDAANKPKVSFSFFKKHHWNGVLGEEAGRALDWRILAK